MKIYAFHLLNDFSGSPKVLSQILKGLVNKGENLELICSMSSRGFLDDIEGLQYTDNKYRFRQNIILRLVILLYSQFYICFKLFWRVKKNDIIYINTVLPFGAALLGRLKGCRLVYHLHESSMKPAILKKFLFFLVRKSADEVIYVSKFLSIAEQMKIKSSVVYNALEQTFLDKAEGFQKMKSNKPMVLMICSLKGYKGINEFIELARSVPSNDFELILNATKNEIEAYFSEIEIPENVRLFPKQTNVSSFYRRADLLLNLSHPDQWVETFGLTALEGMAYGVPCIVPEVGGIAEIVEEGKIGFKVSCYNLNGIREKMEILFSNDKVMKEMKKNCLKHVNHFSEKEQINKVHHILIPQ